MAQLSYVYLHLASIGDVEASSAVQAAMRPLLKAMYARSELLGYRLFRLKDREAAEEELLHHMFDLEAVTHQRYPLVYASMTPLDNEASGPAIDSFMEHQGFQRFR
jgi:hypothetical protein